VEKLQLIESVASVVRKIEPDTLYIPYRNDAHSDHAAVFDAAVACTKSFRYPSVQSVYTYETLSETEFGLRTDDPGFRPNRLVDITNWLDQKISIMHMFAGEMAAFPFPRSETCMRAQATLRGSQANVMAAEAFMVLKEIR
jgi:LmbE family N-acetylglucosaminyl deacetylase